MSAQIAEALTPLCPYCGSFAERVTGKAIYPHRADLHSKRFFRCEPCGAYVGSHVDSGIPLGRLANADLRRLKQQVHALFDPLWMHLDLAYQHTEDRTSGMRRAQRGRCYRWLAHHMQLSVDDCHVGHFDDAQCQLAIDIMERENPTPARIRQWAKGRGKSLRELQERAKTKPVSAEEIAAVMAALPADERMLHWTETGVPLSTLCGNVFQHTPDSVRGSYIGKELYIYPDHRLLRLQKSIGIPLTRLPEEDE